MSYRIPLFTLGVVGLLLTLSLSTAFAFDIETEKIDIVLSAAERAGGGSSEWTVSWNLDGQFGTPLLGKALAITVDSDYSRGDTSTLDRLKTGFRLLPENYEEKKRHWVPVYLLQTEGDHGIDSLHTLLATGLRQQRTYGFVEFTGGASRDVQTSQPWVGDIGATFGYEKQIGKKWKVSTGPKGEVGAIGEIRGTRDRFRYSWDVAVDYKASEKLGLGYRFWTGNTVPDARRTQWLGLTFSAK